MMEGLSQLRIRLFFPYDTRSTAVSPVDRGKSLNLSFLIISFSPGSGPPGSAKAAVDLKIIWCGEN